MKYIIVALVLTLSVIASHTLASHPVGAVSLVEYQLPWPGILPDHPLYKAKVLRNKVIAKMIITPVKRVEFDLLMADKTLYAATLLLDKGNSELAKETALKGENYFSLLVSDYGTVLAKKIQMPLRLNEKIDNAYNAHQLLIANLKDKASHDDKIIYDQIDYFSKTNYQMIVEIRKNNNKDI